ncbi:malonyl-CoA decarboxylase [Vannielia litorea]|uniref:malonyl-CoA decarboxylase n=1 Tax=Vannielia litorea TaxID=1217970 RepID=UPI001C94A5C3|nr:malonyl-CoA decarboxylase [Vannielia litorea]MBY6154407.1 malonyl-CoA decarboxylase [Vannielia litorea]
MTLLADLLSTVFERRVRSDAAARLGDRSLEELAGDLIGSSGEMSGLALARAMLDRYAALDDAEKLAFFHFLAGALGVDQAAVGAALEALGEGQTKASYRAFMAASEPPRQELIRRLNQVPGATGALVQMRADLLRLGRGDEALMALDLDFRHLFASWFNRGFLVLRPISWETSAQVLEKITAYEAVHAIHSWADLRRRLEPTDRRCFAFFHPAMPSEPLIFVEVALTQGIPGSVQALLAEGRPALPEAEADTAVFYSISNCQAGLAGISFGNSLIKQVASDLSAEVPGLSTFVTLSPIPGLASWMVEQELEPGDDTRLRQLAAYYLTRAKGRGNAPRDPVARFHLGNGAQVHMLHAEADTSEKGHAQSHGVMVNYLYDLSRVTQNHERFAESGEIAASAEVRALAQAADKTLTQE